MFDPVRGQGRRCFRFLNQFAETLSRPVEPAEPGDEHVEHVPAQAVTKHLLNLFRDRHGHVIDGLLHGSSITGAQCVVLDVPNDSCVTEKSTVTVAGHLQLALDEKSLTTRAVIQA